MLRVTADDDIGIVMDPDPGNVKGDDKSLGGSVMVRLKFPLWKVVVSCCVVCLFLEAGPVRGKFFANRSTPFRKLRLEGGESEGEGGGRD